MRRSRIGMMHHSRIGMMIIATTIGRHPRIVGKAVAAGRQW